ncbi:MAG: thiamine-phosphate kinase [Nitrospinae bacterium]|nr:thiamine-phosphate kinase [Nitrospinota bacterium]
MVDISQIGEFGLIKRIRRGLGYKNKEVKEVVVGIGDDCAAIKLTKGLLLIATTDSLVEGVHFKLNTISPSLLGKKSVATNISDIAAMGGIPRYLLITIGIPPSLSVEYIDSLYKGIKEATESYNVIVIGGDTFRSDDRLIISITLIGEIEEEFLVRRGGAKVGDKIFVTGSLGDSALGLEILESGINDSRSVKVTQQSSPQSSPIDEIISRHILPTPRLEEGRVLATKGLASAMIDISDGLASDLRRICEESVVGARIYLKELPISDTLNNIVFTQDKSPYDYALYGGEDYELLFTVRGDKVKDILRYWEGMKTPIKEIGEIIEEDEGIVLIDEAYNIIPLIRDGYDHFLK